MPLRRASAALCGALLLLGGTALHAQDDPGDPAPIVWEVVEDVLQAAELAVSGDSVVYLSGTDGVHVWRRGGTGRFIEITDRRSPDVVFMASNGRLFFESRRLRMSLDYGYTNTVVVEGGEAIIETHSGALVAAVDGLGIDRSTDGGDTWVPVVRDEPVFRTVLGRFFAESAPGTAPRLVTVGLGGAAVSRDDGLTWQASNLAEFFGFASEHVVYSAAHDAFYAVINGPVEDGGSTGGVVRESRDGVEWRVRGRLPADGIPFTGRLAAGADGSLWGVLDGGVDSTAYGAVYRSEDRGATWVNVGQFDGRALVGDPIRIREVTIDWAGRVWVGFSQGTPGLRTNGAVLRTVEPVAASGEAAVPGRPRETGVLQGVYPNPAARAVQIRLAPAAPQTVRVRIVDLLGRTVAIVHEGLLAGARTVTVPTARWVPGVYVAEVQADGARETVRFTVVR